MANTVKIQRFRYVLDWCETDKVEIDLDVHPKFELQCRGSQLGDWYIICYKRGKDGYLEQDHLASFNLSRAWETVYLLNERIFKYSTNNISGFTEQLTKLMQAAENYKNKAEPDAIPLKKAHWLSSKVQGLLLPNFPTLGALANASVKDLCSIKGFGRKALEEVNEILQKYGYETRHYYVAVKKEKTNDNS